MDLLSDDTLKINKIDINKTAYTVIVIILVELPAITLSLKVNFSDHNDQSNLFTVQYVVQCTINS